MRTDFSVGLLSAVVLLVQVTLTRLFSIAQFYHFAFLVISLALLGFGVSGSILAVWPRLRAARWRPLYGLGLALSVGGAYLIVNQYAFDSYAIAWDRRQVWRLLLNLLALAVPFTCAGALIGALLSDPQLSPGRVYGANMIGSAVGAAIAPLLLNWVGDARIIVLCGGLATLSAVMLIDPASSYDRVVLAVSSLVLLASLGGFAWVPDVFEIQPSPYKALSHFRRNPDATLESPRHNAYSRLDIVHSPSIHVAPGLSMTYFGAPPPEIGLLLDGDNLVPVPQGDAITPGFATSMPATVAFSLYTEPDVLILDVGGGMNAQIALVNGARTVTGVEPNSLVHDALQDDLADWSGLADDPRVTWVHQEIRAYARQTERNFDIAQLALNDTYRPVTAGAFTLTEDYTLTVEAFEAYLNLLNEDGLLIVTRWRQTPPSEELRTLGLIIEALESRGLDPRQHIVAFRPFQVVVFLVKRSPFTPGEIETILQEAERLQYDMILAPDLPPETVNRYARLPEQVYHTTFNDLLNANDQSRFYDDYEFLVTPPTDNRPFFFHFFKWSQTPDILDNLGRTWQPFGGSGYFVLVALLVFALVAATVFVILPIVLRARFRAAIRAAGLRRNAQVVAYFGSLGLAFLMIEVSTIQQFVLLLGEPTLAIATVLATLLMFSGIGSTLSDHLPWGTLLIALVALAVAWPWAIEALSSPLLAVPLAARLPLSVIILAPLGFLMGIPFANGLAVIRNQPDLVPWAWAINGGASVVSAVIGALVALSAGFTWVLWIGAALYGLAWLSRPRATPA